ncbi:9901_t:CDS:2 [Ambispora leptoticha]|uniref:9901_t:CDS:1 n=1 Tax=Ambispora leptoticha TaxID=144679 RepID=A0A9N9AUX3_9GLOM|nr:9901_t:CDS:2 [Ambispora leptoticha]
MPTSIPYDPKTVALLVIDMQESLRREITGIIPNVQYMVKTCHEKDIPVFWTQHGHRNLEFDGGAVGRWWGDGSIKWGSEEWKIVQELQSFISRSSTSLDTLDFVIKNKTRYDAFYKTELDSLLISLGIKTLIIAGAETNLCCEATARRGFDQDYNIIFLKDATATENEKMHEATLLNLEYGLAKIATVVEVTEWLEKRIH